MGKEHSDVYTSLKGSVETNDRQVLVSKDLVVLGNEKRESTKVRFKTGAISASPNANEESTTPKEEPKKATMRLRDKRTSRSKNY